MRPAAANFHIDRPDRPRPMAERTILADGADAHSPRRSGDIELSHWVPNATASRYKADTSTEICLRYVADPEHIVADLVVNDHVDVDGILSLYALLHPDLALEHRETLVGAAEVGDFLAWADRPGFALAQEVWRTVTSPGVAALDPDDRCRAAFEVTTELLTGVCEPTEETAAGWEQLETGLRLLDDGTVATSIVHDRLVSFVHPSAMPWERALGVPRLNQLVDESIAVWPQARNRDHGQRLQLLSAPAGDGRWRHEVWAPAYCWAETPGRWALPGLESTGDSNRWEVNDGGLVDAVAALRSIERGDGAWTLADVLTPFESIAGRGFPVLVSCVDRAGMPAASSLSPDEVIGVLAPVWAPARSTV